MTHPRSTEIAPRVARYRRKLSSIGAQRIEITVPVGDAALVRGVAVMLRAGGEQAQQLRERLQPILNPKVAVTGQELLEFFQASPLRGEDLLIERDKSTGRQVDL